MTFIVENLRLKELAIVAEQNKSAFNDFIRHLIQFKYASLHEFVIHDDELRAEETIRSYLTTPFPVGVCMLDGIARPYQPAKAKWLMLGWIFRDAPEQRLRPMISSMPGANSGNKQAYLLNKLRSFAADIFPDETRWSWTAISEVFIDRLEGSRRAIKGTLFEAIVRRNLLAIFTQENLPLEISETEIKLNNETYDVSVTGLGGQILIPVKTRETMGGGHALLFTRDIHKSITVAQNAGFDCIPIIIAESWAGNLAELTCKDHIYLNMNPNQIRQVEPALFSELFKRLHAFREII
jgi:hypothetical protein